MGVGGQGTEAVTMCGMLSAADGEGVCEWCNRRAGDALDSIDICDECLSKYQIPSKMIETGKWEFSDGSGGGL